MPYIGKEPVAGNFVLLDSITTSATATYALTKDSVAYSPESARNMIVSLNGVTQAPETAFTVSGSNITFSSALTSSDVIDYILVLGDVLSVGTPSDGTVGTSQMSYPLGNFSSTGIDDNATSTAITIDSSQNVGIGTASPDGTFHVKDAIAQIYIQSNDGQPSQVVFGDVTDASGGMIEYTSSNEMTFKTNNLNERMRIDSSGNVGIGLTPENSNGTWRNFEQGGMNLVARKVGGVDGMIGTNYVFKTDNSEVYKYTAATSRLFFDANEMLFQQAASGTAGTAITWSEAMRINSSGNVGIGNTNPYTRLHLQKDSDTDYTATTFISTEPTVIISNTTSGALNYASLTFTTETNGEFGIGAVQNSGNTASDFVFVSRDSGSRNERMRITSSGSLALGATTASTGIDTGITRMRVVAPNSNYGVAATFVADSVGRGMIISNQSGSEYLYFGTDILGSATNNPLKFVTWSTERMRIDSSGNVLVGTTVLTDISSSGTGNEGAYIRSDGQVGLAISNDTVAIFNRKTSDGTILQFRKDGTTVGSIQSVSGGLRVDGQNGALYFNQGNTGGIVFLNSGGSVQPRITPDTDNLVDLGDSSSRFDDIYATNGTIQTSDANEKQDIEALSEAETRVAVAAKALLRKFRWKSAVEEKGDEARIHFGIIAQDLKAAFEAEGLDAGRYAMFIHSTWTDEETGEERSRMGVRYSELLAFIIAAI